MALLSSCKTCLRVSVASEGGQPDRAERRPGGWMGQWGALAPGTAILGN